MQLKFVVGETKWADAAIVFVEFIPHDVVVTGIGMIPYAAGFCELVNTNNKMYLSIWGKSTSLGLTYRIMDEANKGVDVGKLLAKAFGLSTSEVTLLYPEGEVS